MSEMPVPTLAPAWDPQRPPPRIYVGDYTYKLAQPRIPLPPLLHTVKSIINWIGPGASIAKNVFYSLWPNSTDTTVPTFLSAVGDAMMTAIAGSSPMSLLSSLWRISSITSFDNSGTSSSNGISTHGAIVGSSASTVLPPQTAICISWKIMASYRGGKPRWYLPGLCTPSLVTIGGAAINPTDAASLATNANAILAAFNSTAVSVDHGILGTISHFTGHAVRPVPVFRPFIHAVVHERLDSQRRRSGKESSYPTTP